MIALLVGLARMALAPVALVALVIVGGTLALFAFDRLTRKEPARPPLAPQSPKVVALPANVHSLAEHAAARQRQAPSAS